MATKERPDEPSGPRGPGMWIAVAVFVALVAAVAVYASRNYSGGEGQQGGGSPPQAETVDKAAQAGLDMFRSLAAAGGGQTLGFASADEAAKAQLGPRLDVFNIPLDALKAYKKGASADSMLIASPDAIFPVVVGGVTRSSMTVTHGPEGYQASAYGDGALQSIAGGRPLAEGSFIVRVPALGLQFLGGRAGGKLMLTATGADPRLRMEPGQPMPAETVLEQLVPVANAYNGEPM